MKRKLVIFLTTAMIATALLTACQGASAQPSEGQAEAEQQASAKDEDGQGEPAADNSGSGSESGEAAAQEAPADGETGTAPISEIYLKITSLVELKSPVEMPENFLSQTYGVDTSILDDYMLVISEDATSAETIAILRARDEAGAKACSEALKVIVEEKSMEMENYLPDQYELVKDSKVNVKGNVAYLVISENAKDILAIIEENI